MMFSKDLILHSSGEKEHKVSKKSEKKYSDDVL